MWKDAVTIKYEILSHNLPEETEETHKNLCQDTRCRARDLNTGPPKFEAVLL
jgi:hypothetical protein